MPITIKFKSSDGELFDIDPKLALEFGTIKILIESCPDIEGNRHEIIFPLQNIYADVARLVIEFATYHKDDLKSRIATDDEEYWVMDSICDWDVEFLNKVDQVTLFELISAANFLDYKPLLEATSKRMAKLITGKTDDEIIAYFNLDRNPKCKN